MHAAIAAELDKVDTANVRTAQELAAIESCQPGISTRVQLLSRLAHDAVLLP